MIRLATHDDIPALIECGRRFHAEASILENVGVQFDPDALRDTLVHVIGRPTEALVMVAEHDGQIVGGLGAIKFPMFFSSARAAMELFWYIAPERRGSRDAVRMLRVTEQWARTVGCKMLTMIAIAIDGSPAANLYKREGFTPLETHFVKGL